MCHLFLFEAECSLFTVYCSLVQALQQLYFSSFLFTILAGSGQLSFQGWLGTSGKSLDSAGMLGESQGWQLCILRRAKVHPGVGSIAVPSVASSPEFCLYLQVFFLTSLSYSKCSFCTWYSWRPFKRKW